MQDFVPVRTSTLRGEQKTTFDLYIYLRERYVLYIRQGDSFGGDRLQRLKEKKLKKMYIPSDQENNYRGYIEQNLEAAYQGNGNQSAAERSEIVQGHQQSNAEEVMESPDNIEAYNTAKDGTSKYIEFLKQNDEAMSAILQIENTDKTLGHHGVTVATLATGLAEKIGQNDENQLVLLSLGCLLHDMGNIQNSNFNFAQKVEDFTEEEKSLYLNHPKLGAETVKDKKHFDQPVINIIMQHEEKMDGSGFPQKLTDKKIDALALICGVANTYDRYVTFDGMPTSEAAKRLMVENVGKYPLDHLKGLNAVLKEKKII